MLLLSQATVLPSSGFFSLLCCFFSRMSEQSFPSLRLCFSQWPLISDLITVLELLLSNCVHNFQGLHCYPVLKLDLYHHPNLALLTTGLVYNRHLTCSRFSFVPEVPSFGFLQLSSAFKSNLKGRVLLSMVLPSWGD